MGIIDTIFNNVPTANCCKNMPVGSMEMELWRCVNACKV